MSSPYGQTHYPTLYPIHILVAVLIAQIQVGSSVTPSLEGTYKRNLNVFVKMNTHFIDFSIHQVSIADKDNILTLYFSFLLKLVNYIFGK